MTDAAGLVEGEELEALEGLVDVRPAVERLLRPGPGHPRVVLPEQPAQDGVFSTLRDFARWVSKQIKPVY